MRRIKFVAPIKNIVRLSLSVRKRGAMFVATWSHKVSYIALLESVYDTEIQFSPTFSIRVLDESRNINS